LFIYSSIAEITTYLWNQPIIFFTTAEVELNM